MFVNSSQSYSLPQWISFVCHMLSALLAVVLNGFLLRIILTRNKLSNTFKFIGNQCISDAVCGSVYGFLWIVCSSDMIRFFGQLIGREDMGGLLCETMTLFMISTFYVSSYTMTVVSVDRYMTLCHPNGFRLRARHFVPATWILGLLTAVLVSSNYRITEYFTEGHLIRCRVAFPSTVEFFAKFYNFYLVVIFHMLIPFFVTTTMYALIAVGIRKRIRESSQLGDSKRQRIHERTKKTTVLLMTLVCAYFALCAPIYFFGVYSFLFVDINPTSCSQKNLMPPLYMILHFLAICSTWVNPLIFCYFNQQFKDAFIRSIKGIFQVNNQAIKVVKTTSEQPNDTTDENNCDRKDLYQCDGELDSSGNHCLTVVVQSNRKSTSGEGLVKETNGQCENRLSH